jgi:hypothetical protein
MTARKTSRIGGSGLWQRIANIEDVTCADQ